MQNCSFSVILRLSNASQSLILRFPIGFDYDPSADTFGHASCYGDMDSYSQANNVATIIAVKRRLHFGRCLVVMFHILVVCAQFCVTMRDKNTAKTALNGTFNGLNRITRRTFIYQDSRVLWLSEWMATLTGFEYVRISKGY